MARRSPLNKLSATFVRTVTDPDKYSDGGQLYLQVQKSKSGNVSKSWLFRYERNGKPDWMGLGAMPGRLCDQVFDVAGALFADPPRPAGSSVGARFDGATCVGAIA